MNPNIYDALCKALSDRAGQVDWAAFTAADWDRFAQRAVAEGVGPLIHWTLKRAEEPTFTPAALPPSAVQTLAEAYYQSAAHNALLFKELERILGALGEAGIPVIVLKGAALAHTLYPDPALRPMNDLDLLVPRDYIKITVKLLSSLGYFEIPVQAPLLNQSFGYHIHLRNLSQKRVSVEIHWGLLSGDNKLNLQALSWFNHQTEVIGKANDTGIDFRRYKTHTLTPTAHLLYLSAHIFVQHYWISPRALWLYDCYLLLNSREMSFDWDDLLSQAKHSYWLSAVYSSIHHTNVLFGAPKLPASHIYFKLLHNYQQLNKANSHVIPNKNRGGLIWDTLLKMDWKSRIKLSWQILFPGPTFIMWRYQIQRQPIWFLYYPILWFDLLRNGLLSIWNLDPNLDDINSE